MQNCVSSKTCQRAFLHTCLVISDSSEWSVVPPVCDQAVKQSSVCGKNQRERTSWLLGSQERFDLLKIPRKPRRPAEQAHPARERVRTATDRPLNRKLHLPAHKAVCLLLMLHHLSPSCSTFPFMTCSRSWCPLSAQWRRLQQVCAQCECRTSSHVMRMSGTWVWSGSHCLPSQSVTEVTAVQCWADERGRCL